MCFDVLVTIYLTVSSELQHDSLLAYNVIGNKNWQWSVSLHTSIEGFSIA